MNKVAANSAVALVDPMEAVLLREFAQKRLAQRYSYKALFHWATYGKRNRLTGRLVRLPTIRMPSGLATSPAAFVAFVNALNDGGCHATRERNGQKNHQRQHPRDGAQRSPAKAGHRRRP